MKYQTGYGVNDQGEIVAVNGTGGDEIVAYLPLSHLPVDSLGRMVFKIPEQGLQENDVSTVAISGLYKDLQGRPVPFNDQIAIFGDSITAQCSSTSSGNENYGYITWALQLARQRFRYAHSENYGVGGDTTTMMLARIAPVLASPAGTVIVLGGTNDRGSAAMTLVQTVANLTSIRDQLLAAGKIVLLVTPLPRGDTSNTSNRLSGAQLANHLQVRQWILSNVGIPGVYPVDAWPSMALASSTTGDLIVGMTHDGLHPNPNGAHYLGKAIAAVLEKLVPEGPLLAVSNTDQYSTDNPQGCANINPVFTGTAGTPATGGSGQLGDSWSGTNATGTTNVTRVYSKVTSGGKDWQQVVVGGGPTTAEAAIDIARQISLHTKVVAGTYLEGTMEYEVDSGTANVMSLQLGIAITVDGVTTTLWDADRYTTTNVLPNIAFSGILRTPRFLVPANATDVRLRLTCYLVNATSPTMTVRFRAGALRKIA